MSEPVKPIKIPHPLCIDDLGGPQPVKTTWKAPEMGRLSLRYRKGRRR